METIKGYLENMFKALPKTEEILRLKNELLNNMEEKYYELKDEGKTENEAIGIVISEFGNIDELLNEMGINITKAEETLTTIGLEEAREFIFLKQKTSNLIGIGVSLILVGVSLLVFLSQLVENKLIFQALPNEVQNTPSVILLFLFIVPAVGMFIYSGTKLEKFKYLDEGQFGIDLTTKSILANEYSVISPKKTIGIIAGVCLCILSPVVVIIASLFGSYATTYGASLLLIMIAAAVFIFIRVGSLSDAYKKLLKKDEFSPIRKQENKVIGAVAALVWPLATCAFLVAGLVFNLWYICWIIFPVTGILFGAFSAF
ncbi:permease prefix domain 1-containing protein [Candidatus Clostridium stratigraminis]|uniref:Permease prefix domain 1-containing protein n=1 Tax=Candidatus Clostridium stratigraminis TaxID=3381661 RepID=A0ABW8T3T0_9CLOT